MGGRAWLGHRPMRAWPRSPVTGCGCTGPRLPYRRMGETRPIPRETRKVEGGAAHHFAGWNAWPNRYRSLLGRTSVLSRTNARNSRSDSSGASLRWLSTTSVSLAL